MNGDLDAQAIHCMHGLHATVTQTGRGRAQHRPESFNGF